MPPTVDVREFYETFPYPPREEHLEGFRAGTHIAEGSPRHWFHLYFPDRPLSEDIQVLVAGCGMYQAVRFALLNPKTPITALDISSRALESTRQLKEKYDLKNLEIHELPVEEAPRLGRAFDLVYCTGVLHHLADPLQGLKALSRVLDPRGSLDLMLYGTHGRAPTAMMQELLRRVGAKPDAAGVEKSRHWIDALPAEHPFRKFAVNNRDIHFREGIADLLLHPRERSYTMPQVFDLLQAAGLHMQRPFYQAYYLPQCGTFARSPMLGEIERLPLQEQCAIGELARASLSKHDVVICRPERAQASWQIDLFSPVAMRYVPCFAPGVKISPAEGRDGTVATIQSVMHKYEDLQLALDARQLSLVKAIDGKRDMSAVAETAAVTGYLKNVDAATRQFLRSLWEHDFLFFQIPEAEGPPGGGTRPGTGATTPSSHTSETRPQADTEKPGKTNVAGSARRAGKRLNVGCGRNILPGWINLDVAALPGVDVVADLEKCAQTPLPLPDDGIGEFLLSHLIEHIRDVLPLMQELHRVAKPKARLVVRVPYGSSDDAFEDPTHVRQYFVNSFAYFSQPCYWRADYGYRGDWQTRRVTLIVDRKTHQGMSPQEIFERVATRRNVVQEMVAELKAVKPIREPRRELLDQPKLTFQLT